MIITLIGLSGCGKSHLASRLEAERGFKRLCCDALIETELRPELESGGFEGILGVAEWMGQPYGPKYKHAQAAYLAAEERVMRKIIDSLGEDGWGLREDVVIDSSGSVIYTGEEILTALKQRSRLIHLGIPESEFSFMFEQYLEDPKPVIWTDAFKQNPGESEKEALRRCYPELIRSRAKLYQKVSDVTLVMRRENRDMFSVLQLLRLAAVR